MSVSLAHPQWLALALLTGAAAGWLIWRLYRNERAQLPRRLSRALPALRLAALAMLLLMLLEPLAAWKTTRIQQPLLAVVVDQSASMSLRDDHAYTGTRARWAAALGKLSDAEAGAPLSALFAALDHADAAVGRLQSFAIDFKARDARPDQIHEGSALLNAADTAWQRLLTQLNAALQQAELKAELSATELDAWTRRAGGHENFRKNTITAARTALVAVAENGDPLSAPVGRLWLAQQRLREDLNVVDAHLRKRFQPSAHAKKAMEEVAALTRAEVAAHVLAGQSALLPRLQRNFRVLLYRAGGLTASPVEIGSISLDAVLAALHKADAPFTALGEPLAQLADDVGSGGLAGIVLLSDGQQNRGRDAESVAAALGARGVPIYAVGVGAQELPPDISVEKVVASEMVFAGDAVTVLAKLSVVGFKDVAFPVRIEQGTDGGGTSTILEETMVTARSEAEVVQVPLTFLPRGDGVQIFNVRVPPQSGEAISQNNTRRFRVHVGKEKLKVLLVENEPRWEWRYLRHDLERDNYVEATAILIGNQGATARAQMPATREQMFQYDVILLGDVPADFLTPVDESHLESFVADRAGTLVVLAGKRAMPAAFTSRKLVDLLPIVPSPQPLSANLMRTGARWRVTAMGRENPLLMLSPDPAENALVWRQLPIFYWFAPVARVKPQTEVLVEAVPVTEPEAATALIATHYYGLGKVMWIGTENLWRMRFRAGDEYYHRFWGQVLRWSLLGTLTARDAFVRLGTTKDEYRREEPIGVDARVLGADFLPLEDSMVSAVIFDREGKERERVRLQHIAGSGGTYRGQVGGLPEGEYRVRLDVPALPQRLSQAEATFAVREDASVEFTRGNLNEPLLRAMARASGGRYYDLTTVHRLSEEILARKLTETVRQERELWNSLPFFLLFATLLCAEWFLRKRNGLI